MCKNIASNFRETMVSFHSEEKVVIIGSHYYGLYASLTSSNHAMSTGAAGSGHITKK